MEEINILVTKQDDQETQPDKKDEIFLPSVMTIKTELSGGLEDDQESQTDKKDEIFLLSVMTIKTELSGGLEDDQETQTDKKDEIFLPSVMTTIKTELDDDQEKDAIFLPSLKIIKTKSGNWEDDTEDGFKTPTSLEQKIPAVPLVCPPAPRKPKSTALTKRKINTNYECNCKRRIMLDHEVNYSL